MTTSIPFPRPLILGQQSRAFHHAPGCSSHGEAPLRSANETSRPFEITQCLTLVFDAYQAQRMIPVSREEPMALSLNFEWG